MRRMDWDQIIDQAIHGDFGDLQIEKPDGSIQRGPVTAVRRGESNMIVFDTIWMAHRETCHDDWESKHTTGVMVSDQCYAWSKQDGTVCFGNSSIGQFQLFRLHTGYLEPHEVRGLEPDEVRRSRAWMYCIPLDSDWNAIVDRVVNDLGGDGLVDGADQLRVQEEAQQYMALQKLLSMRPVSGTDPDFDYERGELKT